jgi:hypothetical protein
MATAASYTTSALLLFVFFLRDSGLPWYRVLILQREDLGTWQRLIRGTKLGRLAFRA